ncbi:hypothetical protein EV182_005941 [Spiromyces aspiralis]|uniref:Uncharacterized protein n=1 Tax=Spiromyces aspiralis TaxID=68401 RepID=A0ACC1HGL4_9FUNG|nr:hypothetical protein EV182_005941 [Spiromyces aspiralis]
MTSTGTGILYSLVAHRPVILAEYSETTADYEKVVQAILEKIPPNDSKLTYVYDQYLFHYVCEDDVVYLCMADSRFGRRIPFAFLEDVKHEFLARYGDQLASKLPAYAMNTFSNVLARKMVCPRCRSKE